MPYSARTLLEFSRFHYVFLSYCKKKHIGMKASREQHKDQMSKIATLPSACERILTFKMCSQLSMTHQPESRVTPRCVSEWLTPAPPPPRTDSMLPHHLIKVYEWKINNGQQRMQIWTKFGQNLNSRSAVFK